MDSLQEKSNLCPANDYYKRLALECTGHQIAVDLFLMNSQYSDLSTLGKFYAIIFPAEKIKPHEVLTDSLIVYRIISFCSFVLYHFQISYS